MNKNGRRQAIWSQIKVQAVKLAKEIGQAKAAKELGVPKNTMYDWVRVSLAILIWEQTHRPHKAL